MVAGLIAAVFGVRNAIRKGHRENRARTELSMTAYLVLDYDPRSEGFRPYIAPLSPYIRTAWQIHRSRRRDQDDRRRLVAAADGDREFSNRQRRSNSWLIQVSQARNPSQDHDQRTWSMAQPARGSNRPAHVFFLRDERCGP